MKTLALAHGLDVRQPKSISKPEVVDELRRLAPDAGVIAAYGQILRQPVLDVPRLGILNVHASLLPRWRGAAPIPAAILAGDAETGATIMLVRLALDAGPMLGAARVPILPSDTTATLTPKIAEAGADLLVELLPKWERGEITPVEQDESLTTYAPQLEKADALIDWQRDTAEQVRRKVRAYNPWPIAYGSARRAAAAHPRVLAARRALGSAARHDLRAGRRLRNRRVRWRHRRSDHRAGARRQADARVRVYPRSRATSSASA